MPDGGTQGNTAGARPRGGRSDRPPSRPRAAPPRVFLSYRRQDSSDVVQHLARQLKDDLGGEQVFRDEDDLIAGQPWREAIDEAIESSDAAIVVVGPQWTGPRDDGSRRIDDENDPVASECVQILGEPGCSPVPVMIDVASPPEVGVGVAPLFEHHGVRTDRSDIANAGSAAYQKILVGIWEAVRRRTPNGVLVLGDTDGLADVDELVAEMRQSKLIDARHLSRFAAGACIVSARRLRQGRRRWPDVIVATDDSTASETLRARIAALDEHPGARNVALVGAGVGAGLAVGQLIGGLSSTSFSASSQLAAPIPHIGTSPIGAASAAWRGTTRAVRTALTAGAATAVGVGGIVASGILDDDVALASEFTFGTLEFDVTSTTQSGSNPFAEEPVDDRGGDDGPDMRYLAVDMTVTNPHSERGYGVGANAFSLVFEEFAVGAFEGGFEVDPNGRTTTTLGFEIDGDADLGNAELQLAVQNAEPLVLPLDGGAPVQDVALDYAGATGGGAAAHGVDLDIEIDGEAFVTVNVALDDGRWRGGDGCVENIGRAELGHALVYLPGTVTGNRPSTSSLPSLSFNATNYGVPLQAFSGDVQLKICNSFGALDTERPGDFVVLAPEGTETITVVSGCPCGGLLTGNQVERAFFSTEIDVADSMATLFPPDDS